MGIINEITVSIVKNAKDGESIYSLASRIGYAYSAVYKWVIALEEYGVVSIIRKGNRNKIKLNKSEIYRKFIELDNAVSVIDKDKVFWEIMKKIKTKLKVRFVKGTAATIWTQGSFVTGDFYDRIYFLEVVKKDVKSLKKVLEEKEIFYTEKKIISKRPLIYIIPRKDFEVERKNKLYSIDEV